jgi:CHAD domain-containing protein
LKRSLQELLSKVESRRNALLSEYDECELHQLRVAVRRLRGLLRFEDEPEAWQLRREWGYVVSHTNAARDWDTLASRVENLPAEYQPVVLTDTLEQTRERVWQKVITRLQEDDWEETARRTRKYLKRRVADDRHPPDSAEAAREASLRLQRAWAHAREHDNNRAWHKLRIAVKDLRYNLDTLADGDVSPALELCKTLQETLGQWHDTIIHRDLLSEIDAELGKDEHAASKAVGKLLDSLEQEGRQCLSQANQLLVGGDVLLFDPSDS